MRWKSDHSTRNYAREPDPRQQGLKLLSADLDLGLVEAREPDPRQQELKHHSLGRRRPRIVGAREPDPRQQGLKPVALLRELREHESQGARSTTTRIETRSPAAGRRD